MKYPHIMQYDMKDCGAACLSMISEFYGAKYTIASLRNLIKVDTQGSNIYGIVSGAKEIHFKAEALEGSWEELNDEIAKGNIKLPLMARVINEHGFLHYIVIYKITETYLYIGDPAKTHNTKVSPENFLAQWQKQVITFEPDSEFQKVNKRKGILSKYFKYILQQKKKFIIVTIISLILSTIAVLSSGLFNYILNDASVHDLTIHTYQDDHDHEHEEEEEHEHEEIEPTQATKPSNFGDRINEQFSNFMNYLGGNINSLSVAVISLFLMGALLRLIRGYLLSVTSRDIEKCR